VVRRSGPADLFKLSFEDKAGDRFTEWSDSKRSALLRMRNLVLDGSKDVRVMRYKLPPLPATATPRQIALFVLRTLGSTERNRYFVRVEGFDPGN